MTLPENEILNSIVARVFQYDDVTLGDPKQGYFLRYRGKLLTASDQAYDQLAAALRPYNITPLFRVEGERQVVLLVRGVVHPRPGRISTNIALFILTVLSVMFTGAMYSYTGPVPQDSLGQIGTILLHIWVGWPFAVSLLAILLAHEFGHYFVGRARGAAVSLPYFIPFPYPFSILGTMGAFIQLKELPKNKRALFDLGIAGPLAGLVVAIPVLILGLALSRVEPLEDVQYVNDGTTTICPTNAQVGQSYSCSNDNWLEGNSLLYLGLKFIVKGRLLPAPAHYDIPPVLYWLRFFFTGRPIPVGGVDVMIHPVAMAGWAGILVTFLNLIPAGQLDGGHILYAVFGKRARRLFPFIIGLLAVLGIFWSGWWIWAAMIFFLVGRRHAEPLDEITELDPQRRAIAVLMLVVFCLVFTPVPFSLF
jgi:membrane-associated protease RseP (regulator of RpoE activity)